MPDDKDIEKVTEQEEMTADDMEKEFESVVKEGTVAVLEDEPSEKVDEKEVEKDKDKKVEEPKDEEKEKDKEKEFEPGDKDKEKEVEPDAKQLIEDRVKELTGELPPEEIKDSPKAEEEVQPPPLEFPPSATKLTKEQIANYLDGISDDILPDETFIIGNDEINLKEFAEEMPDQFATVKVLSHIIAEKAVAEALKGEKFVTEKGFQEKLDIYEATLSAYAWWDTVRDVHPDARKIKDSKEFQEWLEGKDDATKRLASMTAEPEDAILVLNYYKEDIAKKAVKEHDDKAKDEKKKVDDLHKETMRSKSETKSSQDVDPDNLEAEFDRIVKESESR